MGKNNGIRPTKESGEIVSEYVKLARKLGKLPNIRETKRFICSADKINNHLGSFNNLKEIALKNYPEIEDLIIPQKLTFDDLNDYKLELEKKKVDKKNQTTLDNLLTVDSISRFVDDLKLPVIKPIRPVVSKKAIQRVTNLTLSDLHFGADIKSEETGYLNYGTVEEARRFAEIVKQTVDYKPQYRFETELKVNLLGDLIQAKLHDSQDAAPMSEQICRAIHLLSQGFAHLSENYATITVYCQTGNHDRDTNRHKSRASTGKWDSISTVIYYALKKIMSNYKNVDFVIEKTPYTIYEVLGHLVLATHGDTFLNVGNPGKNLNIKSIEEQVNRINAGLKGKKIAVVIVGHTHCSSVSNLNTGAILITNGPLPPADAYAVSLGYTQNRASQTLFEMVAKHAVGDIRFIRVDEETDKDKELDKIIKPYEGFNE